MAWCQLPGLFGRLVPNPTAAVSPSFHQLLTALAVALKKVAMPFAASCRTSFVAAPAGRSLAWMTVSTSPIACRFQEQQGQGRHGGWVGGPQWGGRQLAVRCEHLQGQ